LSTLDILDAIPELDDDGTELLESDVYRDGGSDVDRDVDRSLDRDSDSVVDVDVGSATDSDVMAVDEVNTSLDSVDETDDEIDVKSVVK